MTHVERRTSSAWPPLPLDQWQDTCTTLHMWCQIVGKTRLAQAPMENHWWQVPLYVTARGLTTSSIPSGERSFEAEFGFLEHRLHLRSSDGRARALRLAPRSVADFFAEYTAALDALGIAVRIHPVPNEVPVAIPFAQDRKHASYDPEAAARWWRILEQADRVLKRFRGRFLGKASPVHFFWGSFDLAMTRFSGRRAPRHPGGAPNCPDYVMVEAYSHECSSFGLWPGGGDLREPTFYAYAYPAPAAYDQARVRPEAARYSRELGEFILPYESVRTAPEPDAVLLDFLQSAYEAAADLAHWERGALDRPPAEWP